MNEIALSPKQRGSPKKDGMRPKSPIFSGSHIMLRNGSTTSPRESEASAVDITSTHSVIGKSSRTSRWVKRRKLMSVSPRKRNRLPPPKDGAKPKRRFDPRVHCPYSYAAFAREVA